MSERAATLPRDHAAADDAGFWTALDAELALWQAEGTKAGFWWRDDDAAVDSLALARLADLSAESRVPLAVAAVPKLMESGLAPALAGHGTIRLLQHGYAHVNHAKGRGIGAWELGLQRPEAAILAELAEGRAMMEGAFGAQFIPVVAAPWNRIDRRLFAGLKAAGFRGVSASGERPKEGQSPGFVEANIQFDLLAWKSGGHFRGEASALTEIVGHLRRRRLGEADRGEPTGILSHHRDLDEAAWGFLGRLLGFVAGHPGAKWLSAGEIFGAGRA